LTSNSAAHAPIAILNLFIAFSLSSFGLPRDNTSA